MAGGGSPLQWFFDLYDHMSGPLANISKALNPFPSQVHRAETSVNHFNEEIEKLEHQLGKIKADPKGFKHMQKLQKELTEVTGGGESFRHKMFETLEIGHRVGEMLEGIADHAIEFGSEIIKAAAGTETATMAFETFLGKGKPTEELLEQIERIAPHTALQGNELRNLDLGLVKSGFRGKQLEMAQAASLDLGALNPLNPQGAAQGAGMLQGLQERGGIRMSRQLLEIAQSTGVGLPELQSMLAKQFNTKVSNVNKLIESGKVDSGHALQLVYDAIQKQTGGPLGSASERHGKTVAALMHKAGGIKEDLFEGLNKTQGFETFRGFLENLTDLFGGESDFGKKLRDTVGDTFTKVMTAVFGDLSGAGGKKNMERMLSGFLEVLQKLPGIVEAAIPVLKDLWMTVQVVGDVLRFVWDIFEWVGESIGEFAAQVYLDVQSLMEIGDAIGSFFAGLTGAIDEFGQMLWDKALSMGSAIVDGITNGITNGIGAVKGAISDLASSTVDGLKGLLGIHSPSKAFAEMGMFSAQGFAQGLTKGADVIDLAAERALRMDTMATGGGGVNAPTVGGASPATGGGTRRVVIDINVTVNGSGEHHELAAELKEQLRDLVREEIADAGEGLAIEMGVA